MTRLGKILVVCHTLLCLMFATAGVVLNSTRPPYADQAKQKVDEVAFMRKSLRLDDSLARLMKARLSVDSLGKDWLNAEAVYAERSQQALDAELPNTIVEVKRDEKNGLPIDDAKQRFVPEFKIIPQVGVKMYREKLLPADGVAVEEAQQQFQEKKKEALLLTEKASGTDGKGGVTAEIIGENEKISQMKLEKGVYEADLAIASQDIDRVKARLSYVIGYLKSLERFLQIPPTSN